MNKGFGIWFLRPLVILKRQRLLRTERWESDRTLRTTTGTSVAEGFTTK